MHGHEKLQGVYGRIDKVDLLFRCDYDSFQLELAHLTDLCEMIEQDTGTRIGFRVQCFGADKNSGKRIYGVSTWGPACDDFLQMLPVTYQPNISRIDFRIETEVTPSQLPILKAHIEEHNTSKRNISEYRTRARNKEFARSAGGQGLSFGSHKSDTRLTVYKRRGEQGAIEIQVSGKQLQGVISFAAKMAAEQGGISFYAGVCDRIIPQLDKMVREMGYENTPHLISVVGQSEYTLTSDEYIEKQLIELEGDFLKLPPMAQESFLEALELYVRSPASRLA